MNPIRSRSAPDARAGVRGSGDSATHQQASFSARASNPNRFGSSFPPFFNQVMRDLVEWHCSPFECQSEEDVKC